jgi:hypothetical protein
MRRATFLHLAALSLVLAISGCVRSGPPEELAGLWSAGPAACAAGVGVRFRADRIYAVYADDRSETLLNRPHYRIEGRGEHFRVRIQYQLPRLPGGARSAGAFGVLVLERGETGALAPASHNLIDSRTGSARLRIVGDPAIRSFALSPCAPHPWAGSLRGRRD